MDNAIKTKKVIQDLKVVDVPVSYRHCKCCGVWKDKAEVKVARLGESGICNDCDDLPELVRSSSIADQNHIRESGEHYKLSQEIWRYNDIISGGMKVADLIKKLQELDQDAYIATENGNEAIVPNPNPREKYSVLGTDYYLM